MSSPASRCRLLQLDDALLTTHLLPFVPNATFYTVLPCLTRATRRLMSSSSLHKRQAQRRFSIPDPLWTKMRQRPWWITRAREDEDEEEEEDEWWRQRKYGGDEEMDDGTEGLSVQAEGCSSVADRSDVQRAWAFTCRELYRRLTRVERHVFRYAPHNRYGDRYQLPDKILALLVNAWTTRLLMPHLPLAVGSNRGWSTRWVLRPADGDSELYNYKGDRMSLSDFPRLAVIIRGEESGGCKPLACWKWPLTFVAIDCGPDSDGRQPADLNSALIIEWSFDPRHWKNEYAQDDNMNAWDNAGQFVAAGGICAMYGRAPYGKTLQLAQRLLSQLPYQYDRTEQEIRDRRAEVHEYIAGVEREIFDRSADSEERVEQRKKRRLRLRDLFNDEKDAV